jgi:hypothetical protein
LFFSSRLARSLGTCVILALPASACMDDAQGPLAIAVAAETYGALFFGEDLPTVPRLLADHGLDREGAVEYEAWTNSWSMDDSAGAVLRETAYAASAERLLPVLGTDGVQDVLERAGTSIGAVESVASMGLPDLITEVQSRARTLHGQGRTALASGRPRQALVYAFRASDVLWEVNPVQVAQDLIGEAREAWGRNQGSDSYSEEEQVRIRRLMYGASESFDEGDYPRAIRRAYYACQLLGVYSP